MFSVFSVQWVDGSPVFTEKPNFCSQCQFNIEFVYSEIWTLKYSRRWWKVQEKSELRRSVFARRHDEWKRENEMDALPFIYRPQHQHLPETPWICAWIRLILRTCQTDLMGKHKNVHMRLYELGTNLSKHEVGTNCHDIGLDMQFSCFQKHAS